MRLFFKNSLVLFLTKKLIIYSFLNYGKQERAKENTLSKSVSKVFKRAYGCF